MDGSGFDLTVVGLDLGRVGSGLTEEVLAPDCSVPAAGRTTEPLNSLRLGSASFFFLGVQLALDRRRP